MEIIFDQPRNIVIVQQQASTYDRLHVIEMMDYPLQKIVKAVIMEIGEVVLWQEDDYDTIGQWTDQDVINRINELYP
jgi:ABC-type sugar transport system ATPase subunit